MMTGLSGGVDAVELLKSSKCPFCNKKEKLILINTYVAPSVLRIPYKIRPFKIKENWIVTCLDCGRKIRINGGLAEKLRAKEGKSAQRNK